MFTFISHGLLKKGCLSYTLFIFDSFSSIQCVRHGLIKHKYIFCIKDWVPLLKRIWSLSFFSSLSPISWLYDLVTWLGPLWINFMTKSISMLVLLHIKATHYGKKLHKLSKCTQNAPNICSIHSIHTNIFNLNYFSVSWELFLEKKMWKKLGSNLFK